MERPVNHVKIIVAFFATTATALLAFPFLECSANIFGIANFRCGASLAPMLIIGSFVAIPAVAVIALPLFLLFRRLCWMSWWQIVLGGTLSSVLTDLALEFSFNSAHSFGTIGLFCYMGACAGLVFWLVGVRGNEP